MDGPKARDFSGLAPMPFGYSKTKQGGDPSAVGQATRLPRSLRATRQKKAAMRRPALRVCFPRWRFTVLSGDFSGAIAPGCPPMPFGNFQAGFPEDCAFQSKVAAGNELPASRRKRPRQASRLPHYRRGTSRFARNIRKALSLTRKNHGLSGRPSFNAQRPTPNVQRPVKSSPVCTVFLWMLGVGRWVLGVENETRCRAISQKSDFCRLG